MSGLTWGKPVLVKGRAMLYRRTMSYGGTRDQVEWMVKTSAYWAPNGNWRDDLPSRIVGTFTLKRAALRAVDLYAD